MSPFWCKFWYGLACLLPRELVYWAVVRAFAKVSTGAKSSAEASTITVVDMLDDWSKP